jgi:hypothetical protein
MREQPGRSLYQIAAFRKVEDLSGRIRAGDAGRPEGEQRLAGLDAQRLEPQLARGA